MSVVSGAARDHMSDKEPGTEGSSFEDFLKEEGTYEETTSQAIKRVLAFQLAHL